MGKVGLLQWLRDSLAGRLSLYFGIGTLTIMAILGVLVLKFVQNQIEQRDMLELQSKTTAVVTLLNSIRSPLDINRTLRQIRDTEVGHADLSVGVWLDGIWLVQPEEALAEHAAIRFGRGGMLIDFEESWYSGNRHRVVRYHVHTLESTPLVTLRAVVSIDVTETRALLNRLTTTLIVIGLAGAALIALLIWWATAVGLAPLKRVASDAQGMRADALGRPLSISNAPVEVRGLVVNINEMLSRLQESFVSLEQFSADIAHELRTPVNALLTQTQVTLSRDRSNEEYRETLHLSLEELNRLQRMVTNMLFIARADRGVSQAKFELTNLARLVREVVEYVEVAAAEKRQTVEVNGELSAFCDPLMLRRAVTNLLSNAVRYAPEQTQIIVAVRSENKMASIVVSNAFEGVLTQAQIDRMFDRFARGSTNAGGSSDESDGLGLGLSIVRSVMRLHAGAVSARASEQWIRVRLEWPVGQNQALTDSHRAQRKSFRA
ncbi:MAG: heavy metal sensor histidine kinase [Burkholderiaceae bacterium]